MKIVARVAAAAATLLLVGQNAIEATGSAYGKITELRLVQAWSGTFIATLVNGGIVYLNNTNPSLTVVAVPDRSNGPIAKVQMNWDKFRRSRIDSIEPYTLCGGSNFGRCRRLTVGTHTVSAKVVGSTDASYSVRFSIVKGFSPPTPVAVVPVAPVSSPRAPALAPVAPNAAPSPVSAPVASAPTPTAPVPIVTSPVSSPTTKDIAPAVQAPIAVVAPAPTQVPVVAIAPTNAPLKAPTTPPVLAAPAPTKTPAALLALPTKAPAKALTEPPTIAPVNAPTTAPVKALTKAPASSTTAPTDVPLRNCTVSLYFMSNPDNPSPVDPPRHLCEFGHPRLPDNATVQYCHGYRYTVWASINYPADHPCRNPDIQSMHFTYDDKVMRVDNTFPYGMTETDSQNFS